MAKVTVAKKPRSIPNKAMTRDERVTRCNERLYLMMTDGYKLIPRDRPMDDETRLRLITTPEGEEKLARLIEPLAWAAHDVEMLRQDPNLPEGTKVNLRLAFDDIHAIERSRVMAKRIVAFARDNLQPECGQEEIL